MEAYADRWALVTGASSGIGAAFAERLAARGMHLVLSARRRELMEQLAADLDTRHGTRCEIIPADLSDPAQAVHLYDEVKRRGLEIELLVNNAGFGIVGQVADADVDRIMQLVRLNIGAVTELTYRFLPEMLQREHGAIINVSSLAGFQPVAYMGAYAASKAYVLHLSEALWAETRDRGVTVMALCPGTTRTPFFDVAGVPGWLKKQPAQTPEQVVRAAIKALERRRSFVIPGWRNALLALVTRWVPRRMVVKESMKYFRPKPEITRRESDAATDGNSGDGSGTGTPQQQQTTDGNG